MKVLEKIIEYGLYLFIFLLPWQTRLILREGNLNGYWEYGTFSIYVTEILLWAVFLMAAVWLIIQKIKNQSPIQSGAKIKNINKKLKILFYCFIVLLFYCFLSIFWSDSRSVALQALVRLMEGIGLFLVLRIIKFDTVKLAWVFILSTVIQAGLGIWQFFSQSTFACKWLGMAFHDPIEPGTFVVETVLRRWLRAYGSLPHPNMLAGFLAIGSLLSIWLYQKTEYSFKKILLPVCFAILTLGLLTTFSKSVIASFLVALFFLWAMAWLTCQNKNSELRNYSISSPLMGGLHTISPPLMGGDKGEGDIPLTPTLSHKGRGSQFPSLQLSSVMGEGVKITLLKFTLIFLVITTIFSAVFWEPVSTRIYGQDRLELKSTAERLNYFDQAWQLIKKHPMLGVGIGNYTLTVHNELNANLQSWDYQPVHNIYLLVLAELGIVGFLIFLIFILYTLYLILNTFRDGTSTQNIVLALAFFLLLMVGLFDHYFWTLYFGIMLFVFVLVLQKISF